MGSQQLAEQVRIVLVETSHPGNIGAAARAMKTMGLTDLALVNPRAFPHEEAEARAVTAADVLARAKVCHTLSEAVADCHKVWACSARKRSLSWPVQTPGQMAKTLVDSLGVDSPSGGGQVASQPQRVAVVFGNEQSGLRSEDFRHCQAQVWIPTSPQMQSLNLAAAVQVVTYAVYQAWLEAQAPERLTALTKADAPLATQAELQGFYAQLDALLVGMGFLNQAQPERMRQRLHRLFYKAQLESREVRILRGFLSMVDRQRRTLTLDRSRAVSREAPPDTSLK